MSNFKFKNSFKRFYLINDFRFNLCCDSYDKTLERLETVRKDFLLPNLINPSKEFDEMTKNVVSGLQCFNPFDFYHPTMFLIKRLIGVSGYEYLNNEIPQDCERTRLRIYEFNYFNRFMTWMSIMIRQFLIKFIIFRFFFNTLTIVSEFFSKYFPLIAIIRFGPRKAYLCKVF